MSQTGPFGTGAFGTGLFSNSPFYRTKDLIDAVLKDTGHSNPSTETAKRQVVLNSLNNRYALITTKRHWSWLYSSVDTNFKAPYETGTVLLTNGSASVIGTSTAWLAQDFVPNWRFVATSGRREAYTVAEVSAADLLTLDSRYASVTAASATYKLIKPLYELPADCDLVTAVVVHGIGKLELIGPQELRRKQASDPTLIGPPRWGTVVGVRAQDGVKTLEVYPAPDDTYQVTVDYSVAIMKLTDDTNSYPLVPDRHRQILYWGAMADFQGYLKDYISSQRFDGLFSTTLTNMMNDTQLTDSRLRLKPRTAMSKVRRRSHGRKYAVDAADFSRED